MKYELKFDVNLAHFKQAYAHILKEGNERALWQREEGKSFQSVSLLQVELWCTGILTKEQAGEL